jgi:phosphate transport system substrate-binding protein
MGQTCQGTSYSIAYIGVSFLSQTDKAGLGYAALQNQAGKFVLPTPTMIAAAARALDAKTPLDERISLIFAPGDDSYPIINYEYAIVNPKQDDPTKAAELKKFLTWALEPNGGQSAKFLDAVHFLPLPASIVAKSKAQIEKIQ